MRIALCSRRSLPCARAKRDGCVCVFCGCDRIGKHTHTHTYVLKMALGGRACPLFMEVSVVHVNASRICTPVAVQFSVLAAHRYIRVSDV